MPLSTYSGPHRLSGWTHGMLQMFGVDCDVCRNMWKMTVVCFHSPSKDWSGYIPSVTLGPASLGFGTRLGSWASVPATSLQVSSPMLGGEYPCRKLQWNVGILMRSYASCMELECFEHFSRTRVCLHKNVAVCTIFNSCIWTELSNLVFAQILP